MKLKFVRFVTPVNGKTSCDDCVISTQIGIPVVKIRGGILVPLTNVSEFTLDDQPEAKKTETPEPKKRGRPKKPAK